MVKRKILSSYNSRCKVQQLPNPKPTAGGHGSPPTHCYGPQGKVTRQALARERKRNGNLPMNSIPKWSATPTKACKRKEKEEMKMLETLKSQHHLPLHWRHSTFIWESYKTRQGSGAHWMGAGQTPEQQHPAGSLGQDRRALSCHTQEARLGKNTNTSTHHTDTQLKCLTPATGRNFTSLPPAPQRASCYH